MSTKPSALETSFRENSTGGMAGQLVDPEQLDLLRDEKDRLPSNVFQLMRQQGPGRRPGSKNKRNDTLAKLICQQSGDPVLYMASLYAIPLDQMIELIKIASPGSGKAPPGDLAMRALALQLQAAREVSKYVHSQKPVEANVNVGVDATLLMVAPTMAGQTPVEQVMGNLKSAIDSGQVDPSQLQDLRVLDGQFTLVGEDDDDDGDDEDDGE